LIIRWGARPPIMPSRLRRHLPHKLRHGISDSTNSPLSRRKIAPRGLDDRVTVSPGDRRPLAELRLAIDAGAPMPHFVREGHRKEARGGILELHYEGLSPAPTEG